MNKFKQLRNEKNLTQVEIAKIFNIDQTTVSKWENGKAFPDTEILIKLAKFYDVSTDYLLSLSDFYYPDNFKGVEKDLIERPPYEVTDKQTLDILKLTKVMTELQKAQVIGYIIGLLENAGVNVKKILF